MLVELFHNSFIAGNLIFRGGTALHKLFFPRALKYSEDIDFVQSEPGQIGPIFDEIRGVFHEWLGHPRRKVGPGVATLTYRAASEDNPPLPLRIKIEINTREHFQVWPVENKSFRIQSRWFEGLVRIPVYCTDELLATKMRALYQRRKGRDLFDLAAALREVNLSPERIVNAFKKYSEAEGQTITRKSYRANLLGKLDHPGFLSDCIPLLRSGIGFDPKEDFDLVDRELITRLPG
ncbi:MAG: nucleotidyl transferase AbiEii/AbiGii toxin family protein [PVC group bacterium]